MGHIQYQSDAGGKPRGILYPFYLFPTYTYLTTQTNIRARDRPGIQDHPSFAHLEKNSRVPSADPKV
jgi:hypothetical protein